MDSAQHQAKHINFATPVQLRVLEALCLHDRARTELRACIHMSLLNDHIKYTLTGMSRPRLRQKRSQLPSVGGPEPEAKFAVWAMLVGL